MTAPHRPGDPGAAGSTAPTRQRSRRRDAWRRLTVPFRVAALVAPALSLLVAELARRPGTRRYRLRAGGMTIHLRHPVLDTWILEEIFLDRVYLPPAPVLALLRGLDHAPRVLDLGACVGLAGVYFLDLLPGASVIAYEPDAANREVLERTVAASGLGERWQVVGAAASIAAGTLPLVSSHFHSHVDPAAPAAAAVPAVDILPRMAGVDLVKMDIEGSEWPILADPRLAQLGPPAMVVECHPRMAPSDEVQGAATRLLEAAGYTVSGPGNAHDAEVTLWAWRVRDRGARRR